jgi:hypothetical protein
MDEELPGGTQRMDSWVRGVQIAMYTYYARDTNLVWRRNDEASRDLVYAEGWEVLSSRGWVPRHGVTPEDLLRVEVITIDEAKRIIETERPELSWVD